MNKKKENKKNTKVYLHTFHTASLKKNRLVAKI
jgi:hypothetical protein